MGRWSRQVAPRFLAWLGVPEGQRWLDLGCGTGALTGAILDCCTPLSVTGVELSAGFLHLAKKRLTGRVDFIQGNASAIPLAGSCVDVTSSGLVLNFFPDQPVALSEMIRVTKNGGVIGAYVWDYAEKMEYLRYFWEAAAELDPAAIALDEGRRFPICRPAGS